MPRYNAKLGVHEKNMCGCFHGLLDPPSDKTCYTDSVHDSTVLENTFFRFVECVISIFMVYGTFTSICLFMLQKLLQLHYRGSH